MVQKILLSGGTGLVGSRIAGQLGSLPDHRLVSLVRKARGPGERQTDFDALLAAPEREIAQAAPDGVDVAICCLGTTISDAGSKEAMWKVDHDYVVAFAQGAKAAGARQLILMSAAGAGGAGFYLKTKGAVEKSVAALGFARVDLVRPGLMLGPRPGRSVLEAIGCAIYPFLWPILQGPLAKYQGIPVEDVAGGMVRLIGSPQTGSFIHLNKDLRRLARR
ncbi:NAD(P)H-binding protein [Sphingobium sp. Sx8-8]|uniref:NAD(P)H-binding protein n=1 Tax=Sphingobium sp. Sx8-8 TaxID=2933617 RepID=UPI001F5A8EE6|nr:NAD(P)H-binding protein [Sphingobium sp. Sx8-8]